MRSAGNMPNYGNRINNNNNNNNNSNNKTYVLDIGSDERIFLRKFVIQSNNVLFSGNTFVKF